MSALAGKVALVTGASRGIGAAVADALEAAGALAVRISRTAAGDTPLAAIRRSGGADRRIELRCDVSLEHEVHRVAETMLGTVGAPDLLVHSAGAFLLKPLESTSAEEFRRQLDVNLTGAFLVLRALVPAMAKRGGTSSPSEASPTTSRFPGTRRTGRASTDCEACTRSSGRSTRDRACASPCCRPAPPTRRSGIQSTRIGATTCPIARVCCRRATSPRPCCSRRRARGVRTSNSSA